MRSTSKPSEIVLPTGGGCMRPWLWPGGQLHVRRCSSSELRPGDIAVWFDGERLLAHRVVHVTMDGSSVVTRADLNQHLDPPLSGNQVLGKAVRFRYAWFSYALDTGWNARAAPAMAWAARTWSRLRHSSEAD